MKLHPEIRSDRVDAISRRIGGAPTLVIYDADAPAELEEPVEGLAVAAISLPEVWLGLAEDGIAAMVGEWRTPKALANGAPRLYRLIDQGGVVRAQGRAGGPESMAEIEVESDRVVSGQSLRVTSFVIIDGNS